VFIDETQQRKGREDFYIFKRVVVFYRQTLHKTQEANVYEYVENFYGDLAEYFSYIGINLKLKNGFCYFSSLAREEQKMEAILELIDIVSFLYEVIPSFGVGSQFS